jgi:hypothetical protein
VAPKGRVSMKAIQNSNTSRAEAPARIGRLRRASWSSECLKRRPRR